MLVLLACNIQTNYVKIFKETEYTKLYWLSQNNFNLLYPVNSFLKN